MVLVMTSGNPAPRRVVVHGKGEKEGRWGRANTVVGLQNDLIGTGTDEASSNASSFLWFKLNH